jgi:Ethanolamine utilization protein EutJ (predicted chaperonin)
MTQPRFVVGIDLGTSNTALAWTEGTGDDPNALPQVNALDIDQVVAPGSVEPRATLPSVVYVRGTSEMSEGALNLPWRTEEHVTVGAFAREQGTKIAARYIHSSKSWLCHGGVDREARILPPGSPEEDAKRSPAEVATLIMAHLAEAWNSAMAADDASLRLQDQEVTLCVPASFDAGARNLTVAAAERAGFKSLHLLEEPQAAFYSWVETAGPKWRKDVKTGDLVLVVDVGGGTTDFSLIAVTEKDGELELRRVAVGEHILLGGDNMDLALAYGVAARLEKEKSVQLDQWQMMALVHQCRIAKEALLTDTKKKSHPIVLLGRGSSVIGGTIKTELPREGLDQFLLDGFFPKCAPTDQPFRRARSGFREAGLPYAADTAITRHLARFLTHHAAVIAEIFPDRAPKEGQPVLPSAILYNGGVFKADALRNRIAEVLGAWCQDVKRPAPRILDTTDLDLAVARGAAYLGLARRGKGVRIRGGSPRSYYIGIESAIPAVPGMLPPLKAMCVVPLRHGGRHPLRDRAASDIDLCIWTGEPASFRFLSSTTRRHDAPGHACST